MVSTRKKRNQHKRKVSHLNETSSNFVISNQTNACAFGDEVLETQTNSHPTKFGRITVVESSVCQSQILENNFDDKIRKTVGNAVMTVENRMHDAMDNVVIPRVDMAVIWIAGHRDEGPVLLSKTLIEEI